MDKFTRKVCVTKLKEKVTPQESQEFYVVKVFFNIKSREHHRRWFIDLKIWQIIKEKGKGSGSEETQIRSVLQQGDDDLPF